MKDLFGNNKPVAIEVDEWWFNGRIIQKQDHPLLPNYISFDDGIKGYIVADHHTKDEAVKYCLDNPCKNPLNFPHNYL